MYAARLVLTWSYVGVSIYNPIRRIKSFPQERPAVPQGSNQFLGEKLGNMINSQTSSGKSHLFPIFPQPLPRNSPKEIDGWDAAWLIKKCFFPRWRAHCCIALPETVTTARSEPASVATEHLRRWLGYCLAHVALSTSLGSNWGLGVKIIPAHSVSMLIDHAYTEMAHNQWEKVDICSLE